MEKISPLRASLKAFEQFRTRRTQQKDTPSTHTNPFGMTFKGGIISGDVFERTTKNEAPTAGSSIKDSFAKAGKLASSAWVATKNSFSSMKQSVISFGNRLRENAVNAWDKLNKTEISFTGLFENSASLQKRPVGELEEMLKEELKTI